MTMLLPAATSYPGKGRGGRCSPRQKTEEAEPSAWTLTGMRPGGCAAPIAVAGMRSRS